MGCKIAGALTNYEGFSHRLKITWRCGAEDAPTKKWPPSCDADVDELPGGRAVKTVCGIQLIQQTKSTTTAEEGAMASWRRRRYCGARRRRNKKPGLRFG